RGRKLCGTVNISAVQPAPGPLPLRRAYYLKFGVDQTVQNGCNCENSSYNSLEWVVEKRFSRGYSANSAFTWSKAIDMRDAPNPANRRSGRGLSQYDRAAAWVLSHSWELPYGRGKPFGSSAGGVKKAAL